MTRKFTEDRILFATHNAGKLEELQQLFAPHGVSVVGAAEMNLPEPEETENTFVGNARIKAHAATKATGIPALSDDSGIEVEALDNAPGVYTADWAETPKGRDFMMAMQKTQDLLEEVQAPTLAARVSAPQWFWPGLTVMTRFSRARSKARWSGRSAAPSVTATTRCFSRTGMNRHSRR